MMTSINRTNRSLLLAPLIAASLAGAAHAQLANQTNDNRLDTNPVLPRSDARTDVQRATTGLAPAIKAEGPITAIRVEGSSIPQDRLYAATRPFIGGAIDATRLRAVADAIAAEYGRSRIAVYTVLVPEQDFKGGGVRVVAVETSIDEVVIAGPDASKAGLTRAYAAAMSKQRPLTKPALERYLLLMNDIPGVSATPQLAPGARSDTAKLLIDRKQKPIEAIITADTRGAERLGRTQLRGDLFLNGLGYESSQTRFTAATSSDFESFLSVGAAHSGTFTPHAITGTVSLGYYRTRPDNGGIEGEGYTAGVQTSYPIMRSTSGDLYLAGGIDGVDNENALVGQVISSDKTRAARAALSGSTRKGRTAASFGASMSKGIDGLGAEIADPTLSTVDFTKGNFHASLSRTIGANWRIDGAATAQVSEDTLPAAEMISLGGASYGRGFETGAISGDSGVAGMLELARTFGQIGPVRASEAYVFVDGGKLWLQDRSGLTFTDFDLGSAGAGMRFGVFDNASLALEVARTVEPILDGDDEEWRGTLSLGAAF